MSGRTARRPPPASPPADARFMRRALALAERGRGDDAAQPGRRRGDRPRRADRRRGVSPKAGEAHAEVNALARLARQRARHDAVRDARALLTTSGARGPAPASSRGAAGAGGGRLPRSEPARRRARASPGCGGPGFASTSAAWRPSAGAPSAPIAVWVRERRPLVTLKAAATLDGFIARRRRRARRRRARRSGSTSPEARAPRTSCAPRTTPSWSAPGRSAPTIRG